MSDSFDELEDYKQENAAEKENREKVEKVANNIKPEWAILKSEAQSLGSARAASPGYWLID